MSKSVKGSKHLVRRACLSSASIAFLVAGLLPFTNAEEATSEVQRESFDASQEDAAGSEALEQIIVWGVRGSLQSAQKAKRDADYVGEFITLEDIGRYTDQNLAESLQRVPGVQIARTQSGEGSFVSIRGLGPEFVLSTINGRTAFGGSGGDDGLGSRNAFSLDIVAPELTAGVEVLKSVRADMIEGGIGGAINIITAKPLDSRVGNELYGDGLYAALNFDGTYAVEPKSVDPRLSGFVTWKSPNETFGILGTVSYYDRTTLTQIARLITTDFDDDFGGVTNVFRPASDSEYAMNDGSIERLGFGVTAQWRPSDALDISFEVLKNDQRTERNQNTLRMRLPGDISQLIVNPNILEIANSPDVGGILLGGTIPVTPALAVDPPFSSIAPVYAIFDRNESSYAGHVTWRPGFWNTTVDFDASYFESEFDRDEDIAAYEVLNINGFEYQVDTERLVPTFSFLPDPMTGAAFDVQNLQLGVPVDFGFNRINAGGDELAFRLDIDHDFEGDWLSGIEWGLHFRRRSQDQIFNVLRYNQASLDSLLIAAGIDPATTPDFGVSARRDMPVAAGGFLSEVPGIPYDTWFALDAREVFAFYRPAIDMDLAAQGVNLDDRIADPALGLQFGPFGGNGAFEGRETNVAGYVMADFDFQVARRPLVVNIGVRAVHTDVRGEGLRTTAAIDPSTGNTILFDANGVPVVDAETAVDSGSAFDFLPSAGFEYGITESLKFRFAGSKVVTRPDISQIAGPTGVSLVSNNGVDVSAINISLRNPDLEPFQADQYDVTLEWYPDDASAAFAFGYFRKDIKSLIVGESEVVDTFSLDGVTYTSPPGGQLVVSRPGNGSDGGALVEGIELQGHIPFESITSTRILQNFGLQGTYTHLLKNETPTRDPNTDELLPFPGASVDNYSLVGYYDDGGFSSRISYTYRSSSFIGFGGGGSLFNENYSALDANIDYRINENFSIRVQALNILEEPFRQSIVGGRSPFIYSQNGRLITVGVRAVF